jgi:hypothetical protein
LFTNGFFYSVVLFRAGIRHQAVCYIPLGVALRLEISGLSSACYPVNLFRAEVSDQQVVIIPWVYSELRLEISGLLLACYLVYLFRVEVGDSRLLLSSGLFRAEVRDQRFETLASGFASVEVAKAQLKLRHVRQNKIFENFKPDLCRTKKNMHD